MGLQSTFGTVKTGVHQNGRSALPVTKHHSTQERYSGSEHLLFGEPITFPNACQVVAGGLSGTSETEQVPTLKQIVNFAGLKTVEESRLDSKHLCGTVR